MSRDYPVVGPNGGIQLDGIVRDGEFNLVIGDLNREPGAAELIIAITALADMASLYDHRSARIVARKQLEGAIQALHLAGRVAT